MKAVIETKTFHSYQAMQNVAQNLLLDLSKDVFLFVLFFKYLNNFRLTLATCQIP